MEKSQIKQATRIQTSFLNAAEKKALVWMGTRAPKWITSDMMTGLGTVGAIVIAAGYILSVNDIRWLWLACFGFFLNWLGDSLDGTIARVRNKQRPKYGFFIDHTIDCVNEAIMFVGIGLSPLMNFSVALLVLSAYLMLSVYVYISAHLKGEFKLTYAKMGPTELRIIAVVASILFMYVRPLRELSVDMHMFGNDFTLYALDLAGLAIFVALVGAYFVSLFKDARAYAEEEPID